MRAAPSKIAQWREHPAQMVSELFDVLPDPWQTLGLEAFPNRPRMAMQACSGPGKTAELAWLGWNYLLTRPHPRIGVTSITGPNLRANLWTELAYWRSRSPLLQHLFEMTKTEIYAREAPDTWKLEARTWATDANAAQIGNALRGLHSRYVMWLLDETGDYPPAVLPVCENIFAGEPIEAHIVQAGNPTKLEGPLYHAATHRDLWMVIEITADPDDANRTPRVSKEHAAAQIKQYGRDNPWVLVNIFGRFPPASLNALIGYQEVRDAMNRMYREHELKGYPRILGVDVARQGDDQSFIVPRQGLQLFPSQNYRNIDSLRGAGQTVRKWNEWGADACFVDATGGFGWGWIDQMRVLGKSPIPIQFSEAAHDKNRYHNRRAEMYFDFVEWIRAGGALPESDGLMAALTRTTYTHKNDRLLLEEKDQVKEKLGYSPDECDGAVLTFAEPVTARNPQARVVAAKAPYDPFAEFDKMLRAPPESRPFDPFS